MHPEYLKVDGEWVLVDGIAMDDVIRMRPDGRIQVVPERMLKEGDRVALGRSENGEEGVLVWADGFVQEEVQSDDRFSFRSVRSRETSYARDYDRLVELLKHEREHGNVLWVMGPVFTFDADARRTMQRLVECGYVNGIMGGNALATHDLEGAYLHTALGQDIYTQESVPLGHYNHLDVINEVRRAGSIRDDGPLPEVIGDAYESQAKMYELIHEATTIVCMATMLHTIATGNLAASYHVNADGSVRPKYFYAVDAAEFAVNKLHDRGSLAATTIVTNARDFVQIIAAKLGCL